MLFAGLMVVGTVAGWLAGRFMRGNGFGVIGDVIVGMIGAFIGAYIFRAVAAELGGGLVGSLLVGFGAALLLLFLVRLFTGRRAGRRLWS